MNIKYEVLITLGYWALEIGYTDTMDRDGEQNITAFYDNIRLYLDISIDIGYNSSTNTFSGSGGEVHKSISFKSKSLEETKLILANLLINAGKFVSKSKMNKANKMYDKEFIELGVL